MKSLKALIVVAAIAVTATLTGCSSLEQINAHGQSLYSADPVGYDHITGRDNFKQDAPYSVQGS